jgi:hypothetical protein
MNECLEYVFDGRVFRGVVPEESDFHPEIGRAMIEYMIERDPERWERIRSGANAQ